MTVRRPIVIVADVQQQLGGNDALDVTQSCIVSDTAIPTTAKVNVGGLVFQLEANRSYVFSFGLSVTQTGLLATLTFDVAYTGTASATFLMIQSGSVGSSVNALLATVSLPIALGATAQIVFDGTIRATTAGIFTLRGARSSGTATINGGYGRLLRV